jgi:FKBP-type peptidyl-prolyl cis-trans isomerase
MAIRADGDPPPPAYERWTDEEEQRLVALHATNIDISDTQYRREVALKKRELEAAADHFNREERAELQKKWDAMDAEDAEEAITSLQEELQAEVTESTDGERAAV